MRLHLYSLLFREKNRNVERASRSSNLTLFGIQNVKRTSRSSILTLLGERLTKLHLHLYCMLFGEKKKFHDFAESIIFGVYLYSDIAQ